MRINANYTRLPWIGLSRARPLVSEIIAGLVRDCTVISQFLNVLPSYLLQFFILLIHSWRLYTYVKFSYSTPLTSHLPIIMHTLLLALANTYHLVTYMHYRLRPYL